MKILSSLVVIILLLCGGALWFLAGGSLNEYIKAQIESVGQQLTEQQVTVKAVDIQLIKGAGSIHGLNLPSPEGFKVPNTFNLNEITLDINLESLTKEPFIIDAIIIKNPQAFVEVTQNGGSNIKTLIDTIKQNLPKSETSTTEEPQPIEETKAEPKLAVSKIVLAGTALTLDLSALGNKSHQITLPDITLSNVGGKNGLPASELGGVIMQQALSAIWKQTKKVQEEKIKDKAKEKLKKEGKKLEDKAKKKLSELFK